MKVANIYNLTSAERRLDFEQGVLDELAKLCIKIREDLLSEPGTRRETLSKKVTGVILNNTAIFKFKNKRKK